jgi:hypothetical protein
MSHGGLHGVSLAYQLLWNTQRRPVGTLLRIAPRSSVSVEARHLLNALRQLWRADAAPLLLATSSMPLLADLLEQAPAPAWRLVVSDTQLQDPAMAQRVARAGQRGVALVWQGEPGEHFKAAFAPSIEQSILSLDTDQALMALRIAKRGKGNKQPDTISPVLVGQIYEGVASRMLAEHCLSQQGAAALLGWPVDDVLYGYRQIRIQPDHAAITQLVKAIESDAPMEHIEILLAQDALLAYRFLRFVNSAGVGLRREIDALRQGLMVLGIARVKSWALEQLPRASSDRNLHPLRTSMALRARIMAAMMDAGVGDALTRELYLCGLLSQIDLLLAEPLGEAFHGIPLPTRIKAALLGQDGPYWPYLAITNALEQPNTAATHALCHTHGINEEDVNTALLHALCAATPDRADAITQPCPTRYEPEQLAYFHPGVSPKRGR